MRSAVLPLCLAVSLASCRGVLGIDDKELVQGADGGGGSGGGGGAPHGGQGGAGGEACSGDLLEDEANCGVCGRTCHGGACIDGLCPVEHVTNAGSYVWSLAELGDRLYWGADQPPRVLAVNKLGGDNDVLTTATTGPFGVWVGGGSVYWTTFFDGLISRVPIGGGDPSVLTTEEWNANQLVVEGDIVFYTRHWAPGSVRKLVISTGETTDLKADAWSPDGLAVDATHVYWTEPITDNRPDPEGGGLWRAARDGSSLEQLVADANAAPRLVVGPDGIYWGRGTPQELVRTSFDGARTDELLEMEGGVAGLALYDGILYVSDGIAGTLRRVPLDGSPPLLLAKEQITLGTVVVDEDHVYFLANNEIRRTVR